MTQAMALEDYDADWASDAVATILGLAHSQEIVTAEDLSRELRRPPHPNAVGAAFSAARSKGFIEAHGYTTSSTPSRHHGVIRVWRRKVEGAS